ncbi:RHS repeat domain-containing protein [Desulfatibacillum alkenivorans]|uniref:RHS repeat domain-containing protein n=1 Tax=Desulfatibacillum alkenivorans TaxID=259354 RepID=UPI000935CA61|nr:RHS repeat-associated core domain-containing protein [Desulfatibacillum alkenivorans]
MVRQLIKDVPKKHDANGNVGQLISAADGTLHATYEYDPFGRLINAQGSKANLNPYRFSTKPMDQQTGLYYYGYRYLDVELGRWVNRDPIEEEGGWNLYGFVANMCTNTLDPLGKVYGKHPNISTYDIDYGGPGARPSPPKGGLQDQWERYQRWKEWSEQYMVPKEWDFKGSCIYASGGIAIAYGEIMCLVWTRCIKGKRQAGWLHGRFLGPSVGLPGVTIFDITQHYGDGNQYYQTPIGGPKLRDLEGWSRVSTASTALFGLGHSLTILKFGKTYTSLDFDEQHSEQVGLDWSMDALWLGRTWLEKEWTDPCCEN